MALLQQSPSSFFSYGLTYDVFLSFRGTDTRFGFTGNLYHALDGSGIRTFFDDRELQGGDEITPSLFKAIEDSRIFIPVFSINYAFSSFCLDELVHIIECSKARGRLVLPVFYGVDPSQVRHQIGSYGEAIAKHEERFQNNKESSSHNMERLHKWKMALYQVANLSGYHFKIGPYRKRHKLESGLNLVETIQTVHNFHAAVVVDCVCNRSQIASLEPIMLDCRDIMNQLGEVALKHVRRQQNWKGNAPLQTEQCLCNPVSVVE